MSSSFEGSVTEGSVERVPQATSDRELFGLVAELVTMQDWVEAHVVAPSRRSAAQSGPEYDRTSEDHGHASGLSDLKVLVRGLRGGAEAVFV